MNEWEVRVRVVAEVNYLKPPASMNEHVLRRQAQFKIDAMANGLEKQVHRMLMDQIEAERATSNGTGERNGT